MKQRLSLLLLAVLAVVAFSSSAQAASLKSGWQYRWGDPAPLADGAPGWTAPDFAASFQPMAADSEPPGKDGRDLFWLAIPVPAGELRDPTLSIGNAAAIEAYVGTERFFTSGEIRLGKGEYTQEMGAQLIPLPKNALGATVLLRLQTSNLSAAITDVELGEGRELALGILRRGTLRTAVGLIAMVMGLVALALWAGRRSHREYLGLCAGGVEQAAAMSSSGLGKVEEVVGRARASADHLQEIVGLAVATAGNAKEIASSVEQQHSGVSQMLEAIREFATQAERLRQSMTEAESAGSNVREVAGTLLEAAQRGGIRQAAPAA